MAGSPPLRQADSVPGPTLAPPRSMHGCRRFLHHLPPAAALFAADSACGSRPSGGRYGPAVGHVLPGYEGNYGRRGPGAMFPPPPPPVIFFSTHRPVFSCHRLGFGPDRPGLIPDRPVPIPCPLRTGHRPHAVGWGAMGDFATTCGVPFDRPGGDHVVSGVPRGRRHAENETRLMTSDRTADTASPSP